MTTPLERQKQKVEKIMKSAAIELWDPPACQDITNGPFSQAPVPWWSMRLGNPATGEDLFVDTTRGEYALWCEAEQKLNEYLEGKPA